MVAYMIQPQTSEYLCQRPRTIICCESGKWHKLSMPCNLLPKVETCTWHARH